MNESFVIDLWSAIKNYVPKKDRVEVADVLVNILDEYGYAEGLEEAVDIDKDLLTAVQAHFGLDDEEH
jgi:hypothetical protein